MTTLPKYPHLWNFSGSLARFKEGVPQEVFQHSEYSSMPVIDLVMAHDYEILRGITILIEEENERLRGKK